MEKQARAPGDTVLARRTTKSAIGGPHAKVNHPSRAREAPFVEHCLSHFEHGHPQDFIGCEQTEIDTRNGVRGLALLRIAIVVRARYVNHSLHISYVKVLRAQVHSPPGATARRAAPPPPSS